MDPLRIIQNCAVIALVVMSVFYLLKQATRPACGDATKHCGLSYTAQNDLAYCRKQRKYWERKLRYFLANGEHAHILRSMLVIGARSMDEIEDQITMRPTCLGCGIGTIDKKAIDSAKRAYVSAAKIAEQCTFTFKYFT